MKYYIKNILKQDKRIIWDQLNLNFSIRMISMILSQRKKFKSRKIKINLIKFYKQWIMKTICILTRKILIKKLVQ